MTTTTASTTENLALFLVTMDWGACSDEGDYSTTVWAKDEQDALQQVAAEMADSCKFTGTDDECDKQRRAFIRRRLSGSAECTRISLALDPTIEELMKGPSGEWTPEAKADFETIKSLIAKYQ